MDAMIPRADFGQADAEAELSGEMIRDFHQGFAMPTLQGLSGSKQVCLVRSHQASPEAGYWRHFKCAVGASVLQ
jgi:hypothetical protein